MHNFGHIVRELHNKEEKCELRSQLLAKGDAYSATLNPPAP